MRLRAMPAEQFDCLARHLFPAVAAFVDGNSPRVPKSLPDYLADGLDIVSIGINPSCYSVERGFYFARLGNRFWPTLNASGLAPEKFDPGIAAIETLFNRYRIGFTDVVKRPTARAEELDDSDFEKGARLLKRKLERYQPLIAWFHGKSGFDRFLHAAMGLERRTALGLQSERIFVTPNPSGANPAANPKALLPWYRELAQLRAQLRRG